jgi:hypothetical protein
VPMGFDFGCRDRYEPRRWHGHRRAAREGEYRHFPRCEGCERVSCTR